MGVALGRRGPDGWQSEGWTPIKAGKCATVLEHQLTLPYYYLYATDETGAAWQGSAFLCTRGRDFRIIGTDDCIARGYSRTPFFEVAVEDADEWTVRLLGDTASNAPATATTSFWQQSSPEESARHQLYELVTSSAPPAPLLDLLTQSGTLEWRDRKEIMLLMQNVSLVEATATEIHVWLRDGAAEPVVERVSFYDGEDHIATVVRTNLGFAFGIDPGR